MAVNRSILENGGPMTLAPVKSCYTLSDIAAEAIAEHIELFPSDRFKPFKTPVLRPSGELSPIHTFRFANFH